MSRTDRDQKKYIYKHHHEVCEGYGFWRNRTECECSLWWDYRMKYWPVPSWWNRMVRRDAKAFTRDRMQRARNGHLDWAAVDERSGDFYYW